MKQVPFVQTMFPAALVAISLMLGAVARADQQVTAQLGLAMQVKGTVTETGCQNSPGPR